MNIDPTSLENRYEKFIGTFHDKNGAYFLFLKTNVLLSNPVKMEEALSFADLHDCALIRASEIERVADVHLFLGLNKALQCWVTDDDQSVVVIGEHLRKVYDTTDCQFKYLPSGILAGGLFVRRLYCHAVCDDGGLEKPVTLLTDDGIPFAETQSDCLSPLDYSFSAVNHFIHQSDPEYETLQSLALGMSTEIDRLRQHVSALTDQVSHFRQALAEPDAEKVFSAIPVYGWHIQDVAGLPQLTTYSVETMKKWLDLGSKVEPLYRKNDIIKNCHLRHKSSADAVSSTPFLEEVS